MLWGEPPWKILKFSGDNMTTPQGVAGTSQETCIQIRVVVLIGDTPTNWTLQPTMLQAMQGHGELPCRDQINFERFIENLKTYCSAILGKLTFWGVGRTYASPARYCARRPGGSPTISELTIWSCHGCSFALDVFFPAGQVPHFSPAHLHIDQRSPLRQVNPQGPWISFDRGNLRTGNQELEVGRSISRSCLRIQFTSFASKIWPNNLGSSKKKKESTWINQVAYPTALGRPWCCRYGRDLLSIQQVVPRSPWWQSATSQWGTWA